AQPAEGNLRLPLAMMLPLPTSAPHRPSIDNVWLSLHLANLSIRPPRTDDPWNPSTKLPRQRSKYNRIGGGLKMPKSGQIPAPLQRLRGDRRLTFDAQLARGWR